MKYHPAASVNPEMCMSLYVCAHASACLGVSCEYVCVSLSLQGVTLSNRAASCADHPPVCPQDKCLSISPALCKASLSSLLIGLGELSLDLSNFVS